MNTKLTFKQIITAGAKAAGISVILNAAIFFIFKSVGILNDSVLIQPNQPLTIVPVIISSILPTLIGACVFFLFEKYSSKSFFYFSILSIVLTLVSFMSPFASVANMPLGFGIVLNIMHVVVAGDLLYFISRAKKA
jgi:hypothetical protein